MQSVRGLDTTVDVKFEKGEEASTLMWTPLHFAVYYGHLDILKYFIDEYCIKCPIFCLSKLPADSENDLLDMLKFLEDKIYSLLLAYEQNHLDILEYLLKRFPLEWPTGTCIHFLELRKEESPQWLNAI